MLNISCEWILVISYISDMDNRAARSRLSHFLLEGNDDNYVFQLLPELGTSTSILYIFLYYIQIFIWICPWFTFEIQWNLVIFFFFLRGPWDHENYLVITGFSLLSGLKKQRNIKSWDQQKYLVIRGFWYIRPLL